MSMNAHLNVVICTDMNEGMHYGEQTPVCTDCGCQGKELTKYLTCEQYRIATDQKEAIKWMYPELCK